MKEKRKLSPKVKLIIAGAVAAVVVAAAVVGIKLTLDNTAKEQAIDENTAFNFALQDAGLENEEVQDRAVSFALSDGQYQYDVRFTKDDMEYHYRINAATGRVLSVEKLRKATPPPQSTGSGENLDFISEDKVKELALADCGEADVTFEKTKIVLAGSETYYEIEFRSGEKFYHYEISALTGQIINSKAENTATDAPSEEPSAGPTDEPTETPSEEPTEATIPTATAASNATPAPTEAGKPTATPAGIPTDRPTAGPTVQATATSSPSATPKRTATPNPTSPHAPTPAVTERPRPTAGPTEEWTPWPTPTATPPATPRPTPSPTPAPITEEEARAIAVADYTEKRYPEPYDITSYGDSAYYTVTFTHNYVNDDGMYGLLKVNYSIVARDGKIRLRSEQKFLPATRQSILNAVRSDSFTSYINVTVDSITLHDTSDFTSDGKLKVERGQTYVYDVRFHTDTEKYSYLINVFANKSSIVYKEKRFTNIEPIVEDENTQYHTISEALDKWCEDNKKDRSKAHFYATQTIVENGVTMYGIFYSQGIYLYLYRACDNKHLGTIYDYNKYAAFIEKD